MRASSQGLGGGQARFNLTRRAVGTNAMSCVGRRLGRTLLWYAPQLRRTLSPPRPCAPPPALFLLLNPPPASVPPSPPPPSPPKENCPGGSDIETIIMHRLSSTKFTAQNNLCW